jgi:hypothetical protein
VRVFVDDGRRSTDFDWCGWLGGVEEGLDVG